MAEVLRSGFDALRGREERFRLSSKWFAFALGGALLASSLAGTAQVTPPRDLKQAAASNSKSLPAAEPAGSALAPARPNPAQPPLPPVEPVRPPVVAWDGGRLTIDAENSTLSDVLLAIRSRTGASIEMPGSASAERVAIHVGPAPIREVVSALLYGTNFNYVIQASENDARGLGKLILSSRDGDAGDDLIDTDARADRNVRLMPGYSAPGKRDFEVTRRRAMKATTESAAAAAEAGNQDSAPVANDAGSNDTPSTDSQPVASSSTSTDSSSAPPDASLTAATAAASTGDASTGDDTPIISNMEQGLQKMYDQRRQIQAEQNQVAPRTTPPPPPQ